MSPPAGHRADFKHSSIEPYGLATSAKNSLGVRSSRNGLCWSYFLVALNVALFPAICAAEPLHFAWKRSMGAGSC
jgi:hypothetical protein